MTKFIFVRHGQSQANADGILAIPDSALSELGLEQARQVGQELKKFDIKTIVSSPFIRVQQTAEIIAGELGIDIRSVKIIDELHERRLGKLEGTPKNRKTIWYETTVGRDDMERRDDLIKRMQKCLTKIQQLSNDGLVLVIGHSCAGFYLIEVAAGHLKFEDFSAHYEITNASYIEVEIIE